eukprot:2418979-Rhodomonas_salina.2
MIAKGDHTHHTPLGPYMGLQRPGASRPPAAGTPQCEQDEEEDDRDEVSAMEQTPPKATVKKGKKFSSALLAKPDPKMMWSVKTLSPVTERMASLHRTTSRCVVAAATLRKRGVPSHIVTATCPRSESLHDHEQQLETQTHLPAARPHNPGPKTGALTAGVRPASRCNLTRAQHAHANPALFPIFPVFFAGPPSCL